MDTVTTGPAFGSVEHYAELLRRHAHRWTDVRLYAIEIIGIISVGVGDDEHRDLQRIRNVLEAVELVRTEAGR